MLLFYFHNFSFFGAAPQQTYDMIFGAVFFCFFFLVVVVFELRLTRQKKTKAFTLNFLPPPQGHFSLRPGPFVPLCSTSTQ